MYFFQLCDVSQDNLDLLAIASRDGNVSLVKFTPQSDTKSLERHICFRHSNELNSFAAKWQELNDAEQC